MKFTCERCGKRFSSVDEPLPGRVYRIRCRCGNTIQIAAPHAIPDTLPRRKGGLPPREGPKLDGAAPVISPIPGPPRAPIPAGDAHAPVRAASARAPPPSPRAEPLRPPPASPPLLGTEPASHLQATPASVLAPDPFAAAPSAPAAPGPARAAPSLSTSSVRLPEPAPIRPRLAEPEPAHAPAPERSSPLADDPFAAAAAHAARLEAPPQPTRASASSPHPNQPSPFPPYALHAPPSPPRSGGQGASSPQDDDETSIELSVSEQYSLPRPKAPGRLKPALAVAGAAVLVAGAAGAAWTWKTRVAATWRAVRPSPQVSQAVPRPPPPPVSVAPPVAPPPLAAPAPPPPAAADAERKAELDRRADAERRAEAAQRAEERRAEAERRAQAERHADAERTAEAQRAAEAERWARAQRSAELKRDAEARRKEEAERKAIARREAEARRRADAEARKAEAERQALAKRQADAERKAEAERQALAKRQAETERKAEAERRRAEQRAAAGPAVAFEGASHEPARKTAGVDPALAEALRRKEEAVPPRPHTLAEGLDPTEMQTVIRGNRAALEACVAKALADPSTAVYAGRKVSLIILVAPNGRAEAALEETDLDASPFGACLRRAASRMTFPAFRGEPVGARIPLVIGKAE